MKLHQVKKLLYSEWNYPKLVRQSPEWEKILADGIVNKGLISKIYQELIQLKVKKKLKIDRGPE